MLDEILEYREYTYRLDRPSAIKPGLRNADSSGSKVKRKKSEEFSSGLPERLCPRKLQSSLSGLERPMTIIARHFWFGVPEVSGITDTTEKVETVIAILKSWSGLLSMEIAADTAGESTGSSSKTSRKKEEDRLKELRTLEIARQPYCADLEDWFPRYVCGVLFEPKYASFFSELNEYPGSPDELNQISGLAETLHKDVMNLNIWNYAENSSAAKGFHNITKEGLKQIIDEAKTLKDLCSKTDLKSLSSQIYNILTVLKNLRGKKNSWPKSCFSPEIRGPQGNGKATNNFKTLSFEKIVALAAAAGPLRQFVLVTGSSFDVNGLRKFKVIQASENRVSETEGDVKGLSKRDGREIDREILQKIIPAYLVAVRDKAENSRISARPGSYVTIDKTALLNWNEGRGKTQLESTKELARYCFKSGNNPSGVKSSKKSSVVYRQLISSRTVGGNVSKIRISGEYLRKMQMELLLTAVDDGSDEFRTSYLEKPDRKQFVREHGTPGHSYHFDNGCKEFLSYSKVK